MTTVSYSDDLHKRAIEYVEAGNSQQKAAKLFGVSTTTMSHWWLAYKQDGRKVALPRGGSKGKVCKESLKQFVEAHPNKTLKEMGEQFGVTGSAIGSLLKQLGYSYKKNVWLPRS